MYDFVPSISIDRNFQLGFCEEPPYPKSLPEFQRLFPDEASCARYLIKIRWPSGFECPKCKTIAEPFYYPQRISVMRCRKCRRDTGLLVGSVMERSRVPLSVWFWAAYHMTSQTPGMSAVQFQRQLGLTRYETAFQILHRMRAGMVRANQEQIGGNSDNHVEVDEVFVGGKTRGKGSGNHNQVIVAGAVEVKWRKGDSKLNKRRSGRMAGRIRLSVVPDRSAASLCGFVQKAIKPKSLVVTDGWHAYRGLGMMGYQPVAVPANGDIEITEEHLPMIHLVFSNLKTWLLGIHHGVSHQHLQAYLNEFAFRFNRRFYPFSAFRSLLGIASVVTSPTYEGLYSGVWTHPNCINQQSQLTPSQLAMAKE